MGGETEKDLITYIPSQPPNLLTRPCHEVSELLGGFYGLTATSGHVARHV